MNNTIFQMFGISHESASDEYQAMPTVVEPSDVETVIDKIGDEVDGINSDRLEDEDIALDNLDKEIQDEIKAIDEATSIEITADSEAMQIEGNEFAEKLGGVDLSDDAPTVPILKELEEAGEINSALVSDSAFAENNEVEEMLEEEYGNKDTTPLSNDPDAEVFEVDKHVDLVTQSAGDGYADNFEKGVEEDPAPLVEDAKSDDIDGIEETEVKESEIKGDDTTALDEAEEVSDKEEAATEEVNAEDALQDIDYEINSTLEDSEKETEAALKELEIDGSSAFDEVEDMISVNTEEGNQEFKSEMAKETEDDKVETEKSVVDVIEDTVEADEKEYEENDPVDHPDQELLEEGEAPAEKKEEAATESIVDLMRKKILSWI